MGKHLLKIERINYINRKLSVYIIYEWWVILSFKYYTPCWFINHFIISFTNKNIWENGCMYTIYNFWDSLKVFILKSPIMLATLFSLSINYRMIFSSSLKSFMVVLCGLYMLITTTLQATLIFPFRIFLWQGSWT